MSVFDLAIGEPYFGIRFARDEDRLEIEAPTIVINAAETPIDVVDQALAQRTDRFIGTARLSRHGLSPVLSVAV